MGNINDPHEVYRSGEYLKILPTLGKKIDMLINEEELLNRYKEEMQKAQGKYDGLFERAVGDMYRSVGIDQFEKIKKDYATFSINPPYIPSREVLYSDFVKRYDYIESAREALLKCKILYLVAKQIFEEKLKYLVWEIRCCNIKSFKNNLGIQEEVYDKTLEQVLGTTPAAAKQELQELEELAIANSKIRYNPASNTQPKPALP